MRASKILIDDTLTDEWGIEPKERIDVPTPEQDTQQIHIKGRHGTLTKKYGFEDIPLPVIFTMVGNNFKRIFRESKMNLLFAKRLQFKDDDSMYYKIKSVSIDPAENKNIRFGEFTANFTLAPFQYEIENDPVSISGKTTINNLGYESQPVIEATCSGTGKLYINDQEVQIKDINGTITIDSEMSNAYRIESGSTENLNNHMVGGFPVLEHGENVIDFDGDISKLEITKNSRWL